MNVLVLLALAHADTYTVSSTENTFPEAVAAALKHSGADTIDVDAGYNDSGDPRVELGDQEVEIKGHGAELPAMVGDSTRLTMSSVVIRTATESIDAAGAESPRCSLCFVNATVDLTDVEISGAEPGHGIAATDTEITAKELNIHDTFDGFGMKVTGTRAVLSVEIEDSKLTDNADGAIMVVSATEGLPVTLHSVTIDHATLGGLSGGAALFLYNADLTMDDSKSGDSAITDCESAVDPSTPIYSAGGTLDFTDTNFTGNEGVTAGLLYADGASSSVTITGGLIGDNVSSSGVEMSTAELTLHDVSWAPGGSALTTRGLTIQSSRVDMSAATTLTKLGYVSGGTLTAASNIICGGGVANGALAALFTVSGGKLVLHDNVITSVWPLAGSLFLVDGTSVSMLDNTLVSDLSRDSFVSGSVTAFTFENNIMMATNVSPGLSAEPTSGTVDYNLFYSVVGVWAGMRTGSDTNSTFETRKPGFVTTFDPAICGSSPDLLATSWAIDHGDPTFDDGSGTLSDIGARDFVGDPDTGGGDTGSVDTGDTGGDTAVVETATPDTADSAGPDGDGDGYTSDDCDDGNAAINPGADDDPTDTVDQDCDGEVASVTFTGGCGCASTSTAGSGIAAGAAAVLLILRVRRSCLR